jgi:hypothetical protein
MHLISRLALTVALIFSAQPAKAQQAKPAAANAPTPKQGELKIDVATLALLIKGAVMALHQANLTGNYSVLRDLGTPVFLEQFDQTALGAAFANLRARKVNLGPALLVAPNLTKNPELNKNGELVLVGDFPTQPLQIHFELAFAQLDGVWRIAGMAVDAIPARTAQASVAPAARAQAAPAKTAGPPAAKPVKKPKKAQN